MPGPSDRARPFYESEDDMGFIAKRTWGDYLRPVIGHACMFVLVVLVVLVLWTLLRPLFVFLRLAF